MGPGTGPARGHRAPVFTDQCCSWFGLQSVGGLEPRPCVLCQAGVWAVPGDADGVLSEKALGESCEIRLDPATPGTPQTGAPQNWRRLQTQVPYSGSVPAAAGEGCLAPVPPHWRRTSAPLPCRFPLWLLEHLVLSGFRITPLYRSPTGGASTT